MPSHRPAPLRLSPKARQDFVEILRYTGATWGVAQMMVYRDKINDALKSIGSNPQLGHPRTDLPAKHLAYLVGSHIIIYRIDLPYTGIVRILHQRMSLARHI